MSLNFLESPQSEYAHLPYILFNAPVNWQRLLVVALVAILACLLHCLGLFWYLSLPTPAPVTEAKPLPMIDIALEAPNMGAQAEVKPEVTKPTPPTPKPKPKKIEKAKPKPKPKEKSEVKKPAPKQEDKATEAESSQSSAPIKEPVNKQAVAGNNANSASKTSQSGKVTAARGYVGYLSNPKPNYPGIARSRHWEGLVLLRVYVTPDGRCGSLNLARSSGHDVLDESAMTAVRNWKFIPGKRGDTPIASWATVPIQFTLRN